MSRVAKNPVNIPAGVEINLQDNFLIVKGIKGSLSISIHHEVVVKYQADQLLFSLVDGSNFVAIAGTMRAIINNMVIGVSQGFERKLLLTGVGYRAQAKGDILNLSLGFSHPIEYKMPNGVTVETPSQNDIIIKGIDKQLVGQVASEIRNFRIPEPYKGKGVRYADEIIRRKEAKKK